MPAVPQQLPSPGQEQPLSTNRVVSGIAKGGTEGTWLYPSEQMFYNSLKRKGKGGDVKVRRTARFCMPREHTRLHIFFLRCTLCVFQSQGIFFTSARPVFWCQEDDVNAMVAIHNNMNERTWRDILVWEGMHCQECSDPRLLRFTGRPDDLSPKARLRMLLGQSAPFDR
jgi:cytochrome c heme-lyase